MKRILKLGILFFYVSVLSDVLGQSGMYRASGGVKIPYVTVFRDGQFISIKQNEYFPYNDTLFFIVSNPDGRVKSVKPIASFSSPIPTQFNQTKDGGYIIKVSAITANSREGFIKLNEKGELVWKLLVPISHDMYGVNMLSDSKGNTYLVLSTSDLKSSLKTNNPFGGFANDIWVIKLNSKGEKVWDRIYGGDKDEYFYYARLVDDYHIVVMGNTTSDSSGNKRSRKKYNLQNFSESWALDIDSNGDIRNEKTLYGDSSYYTVTFFNFMPILNKGFVAELKYWGSNMNNKAFLVGFDEDFNTNWIKTDPHWGSSINFANDSIAELFIRDKTINRINENGDIVWSQELNSVTNQDLNPMSLVYTNDKFLVNANYIITELQGTYFPDSANWIWLDKNRSSISGRVFPDFNADCNFNKPTEYTIPYVIVRNKAENTYAITNDSNYTIHIFEKDTAVLEVVNLDGSLYTSCGKNSITLNMSSNNDTTGIDFPIRSNKSGHCINITSFSSGLLRPGRWGDYQLNFQNNAFDTAYNAYIEIELDMSRIDSIISPYAFSQIGNVLKFNLGHIRPFGFGTISYSIKLKTSVVIGSSQCHRAKVFPHCSLYPSNGYDGSDIKASIKCLGNNIVELELENAGSQNQTQRGKLAIYQDESLLKQDSFKMDKGTSSKFQYQLDDNKVFTAEVYSSNAHPVTPILIRHQDLCANKRPIISNNPVVNFYRHDEAKEYEESCRIVQGSYDPNVKSVQPSGFLSEHYTANGTELKYRIDFQNTGTDTAFRVVLVDTLSALLNAASFVPGVSSHPYSLEFGGRAVKFIFDPIALVDSFKNEPLSHGYVHFKIKPIAGISPKTKIENNADIYFDYNAPIRTNTVFNTIFDTIQIYVPKGGSAIVENDKTSVILFPNPTTDKFFIQISEPVVDLSIEIYDMQGRMIKTISSTNNQTIEVSAQGMTKGIYHIRCMSGEKLIVVKKVMVE